MARPSSYSRLKPLNLLTKVKQDEGSHQPSPSNCEHRDLHTQRLFMLRMLWMHFGKPLQEWENFKSSLSSGKTGQTRSSHEYPLPDRHCARYPFSDQQAACNALISDTVSQQSWLFMRTQFSRFYTHSRFKVALSLIRDGSTWYQRIISLLYVLFYEVTFPLSWLMYLVLLLVLRMLVQAGFKLPGLSVVKFMTSGLVSSTALPPGENGYTKVFQGGSDVDLDDLEAELMTRNKCSFKGEGSSGVTTISISYKHYANRGVVPGDDRRICRRDLHAIARLIQVCAPYKL